MKKLLFFLIIIVGVGGLYIIGAITGGPEKDNDGNGNNQKDLTWNTYTNEQFGFAIDIPEGWEITEFPDDKIAPSFNIHKVGDKPEQPLTHHSQTEHVSIFPEGVPTEGVFGERATSTVSFREDTSIAYDYVLENGDAWATYATFGQNIPDSWMESGFLWAAASIENMTIWCEREGEVITQEECDPLVRDDTIIRTGSVNTQERAIEKQILESFHFTQQTGKENLIRLHEPAPEEAIASPLTVRGEARGPWYFEATFPLVLTDWDGRIIAQGYAEAQGDWMTEEFVPFEGTLEFETPQDIGDFSDYGSLILKKANASGLPEHDDALEIRVRFR